MNRKISSQRITMPTPADITALVNSEIQKLVDALDQLADYRYSAHVRAPKPFLPSLRPPKPYRIGVVEVRLEQFYKTYINDDWHMGMIGLIIKIDFPPYISRTFDHTRSPFGKDICEVLTPNQILCFIQHLRTLQKWVYDRIEGLRRAEQEIAQQQAHAITTLETELALYTIGGNS